MKQLLFLLCAICINAHAAAQDITLTWLNDDGTTNQTTTCTIGGDLILPPAPTKQGYEFIGWAVNYIPIEYLQSTGTQYIDIGYNFSNVSNARVVLDAIFYGKAPGAGGAYTGVTQASRGPGVGMSSDLTFYYFLANRTATDIKGKLGQRYLFDLNGPNATYKVSDTDNNVVLNMSGIARGTDASLAAFYLFGYAPSKPVGMRIYSFKLWDNGVLVRDMVPALDADDTPGMYDIVNGKFYYSAVSGSSFIAGPIITE